MIEVRDEEVPAWQIEGVQEAASEFELQDALLQVFEQLGLEAKSFGEAGVLTYNKGIVLRVGDHEFQLAVNQHH